MTIDTEWKRQYNALKKFITSNPEINIHTDGVAIPENLRDKFYNQFDDVRRSIVKAWSSSFDFDVYTLGKNYIEAENKLAETLNLKHMELPVDLASFLHSPGEGMTRHIYNRLFELLQGKITENDFERMVEGDLNSNVTEFFRLGYEQWAAVSILLLLEPDEILGVSLDDDYNLCISGLDQITFGKQYHHPAKRIPEFIIHSKKLDRYIAFKMPLTTEVAFYSLPVEIPTQRLLRDRTGDTSSVLGYRMVFLSFVQDIKKFPIFADMHERTINGPDLAIEFLMEHDLSDPEAIRQVQNRMEIIKPRLGGNIVLMDPESISGSFDKKDNLDVFSVGLGPSGLQPIIDKLAN